MGRRPRAAEPAEHQLQVRLTTEEVAALDAQRLPGEARSAAARRLLGLALDKADPFPARTAALERLRGMLPPQIEERVRSLLPLEGMAPRDEADWVQLALQWAKESKDDEGVS